MGEVGRWDPDLFDRFRAARSGSARRQHLLGELIRINEPLVKVLVAQLGGRPPSAQLAGNLRNRMKVPGAERLEWESALNAGRIALWKALESFDPAQGKISFYLKWKIRHELQVLVGAMSVVRVQRGEQAPGMEYVEDDKHLDWLTREVSEEADIEPELLEQAPAIAVPLPPAPRDTRNALEVLFAECRFAPSAREAVSVVRGRLFWLARDRGEWIARGELTRALEQRGVRAATVRVAWWPVPVRGFAGIALQSAAKTRCARDSA